MPLILSFYGVLIYMYLWIHVSTMHRIFMRCIRDMRLCFRLKLQTCWKVNFHPSKPDLYKLGLSCGAKNWLLTGRLP